MPRVSPGHKRQRRAHILDAARACFARSGFQGATLQDVFAEAGLSAGCVYNYFQSKQDLVLAIAEERHEVERQALDAASAVADPIEALMVLSRQFLGAYLVDGADAKRRISLLTWSESLLNEAVRESVQQGLEGPRKRLVALIARGQRSGGIRGDVDADATARAMIALLHGAVLQKLWEPGLDETALLGVCDRLIQSLRA